MKEIWLQLHTSSGAMPYRMEGSTDMGIQLSRLAVQTNYFPLWVAENGKLRLTYEIENPRPIKEFTRLMGRFSHLSEQDLEEFQRMVDERYAELKNLSRSHSIEVSP